MSQKKSIYDKCFPARSQTQEIIENCYNLHKEKAHCGAITHFDQVDPGCVERCKKHGLGFREVHSL